MEIGKLNRKITLQQIVEKRDEAGYPIPSKGKWEDVATIWAERLPLRGREFFAAASVQHEHTVTYRIRYRKGVAVGMRIADEGRFYPIYAVQDDVKGDRTETMIMTTEKTNGRN